MKEILTFLKKAIDDESLSLVSRDCVTSTSGKKYFYKLTSVHEEQYIGEAESLKLLSKAAPGLAPGLISCRTVAGETLFISEYIDLGGRLSNSGFEELARRLATEVHRYRSENGFGFGVPSYCGATKIRHGWFPTWSECFSNMIDELLSQLRAQGLQYLDLCRKGQELRNRYRFISVSRHNTCTS
jgi:protein-ribulosamine 3-kinase